MPKLYTLETERSGDFRFYKKAYTDRKMAEYVAYVLNAYHAKDYEVREIELPFIGKHVCYVYAYFGFDYGWDSIYNEMECSDVYSCVVNAKESPLWQRLMERVIADGKENYIIRDTNKEQLIASKDIFGEPWFYGDVMGGNFNAEIRRIRVIRDLY
jgi:hypothetical protein